MHDMKRVTGDDPCSGQRGQSHGASNKSLLVSVYVKRDTAASRIGDTRSCRGSGPDFCPFEKDSRANLIQVGYRYIRHRYTRIRAHKLSSDGTLARFLRSTEVFHLDRLVNPDSTEPETRGLPSGSRCHVVGIWKSPPNPLPSRN